MTTKTCSKCGEVKAVEDFYSRYNQCKTCFLAQQSKYRKEHLEKYRGYSAKYRKEHQEKERECKAKYYKEHVETIRERKAKYYKEHWYAIHEYGVKRAVEMPDSYIRNLLANGSPVHGLQLPCALLEAKRIQLKINRYLKEMTQ